MEAQRINGLDVWRTIFLLLGICLHTSDAAHVPLEGIVQILTSMFRMGAFMAIAGALAGLALNSRSVGVWYQNKVAQLAIPLVASLVLSNAMLYPLNHSVELYHVWFLICLIEYCTVLYFASAFLKKRKYNRDKLAFLKNVKLIPVMIAIMALTIAGMSVTHLATTFLPTMKRTSDLISNSIQFAIPFLLGYSYGKYPEVRRIANSNSLGLIVLIVICLLPMSLFVYTYGYDELSGYGKHQTSLKIATNAAIMYPIICLVFQQAFKQRTYPGFFVKMSKASYTVYLVHFPIAGYCLHFFPRTSSPLLDYLIRITFVLITSYCFHLWVVRSKLLTLLFNGKWYRPRGQERRSVGSPTRDRFSDGVAQ